eukprot:194571-Alexandrium_andersonii.AAC.1
MDECPLPPSLNPPPGARTECAVRFRGRTRSEEPPSSDSRSPCRVSFTRMYSCRRRNSVSPSGTTTAFTLWA